MTTFLIVWSAFGTVVALLFPLAAPAILGGCMLMPLALGDWKRLPAALAQPRLASVLVFATALFMAVNARWSLDPPAAQMAVAVMFLFAVVFHVGTAAMPLMQPAHLRSLCLGLLIGFTIAAVILTLEYTTRMTGQRALENWLAAAGITGIRINAGTWAQPNNYGMTRNLSGLILLLWLACAIALGRADATRPKLTAGVLITLVAVCALLSPSATAKISLVGGGGAAALAIVAPRAAVGALTALWLVLCVAMMPIAQALYRIEAYRYTWLPPSARHRIVIWGATSDWYWKTPVFGSGIATARAMDAVDTDHADARRWLTEGMFLNWHAHNAYLQVWFESGAVGAALLLLLGLTALATIRTADPRVQPALCGAFASAALIAATGFSIWAAWYMSVFGLVTMFSALCLAEKSARTTSATC